jgi:hypothetical protein
MATGGRADLEATGRQASGNLQKPGGIVIDDEDQGAKIGKCMGFHLDKPKKQMLTEGGNGYETKEGIEVTER